MDIWSEAKRSEVMSKIRGKNTKPELLVRSYLFKKGFRYHLHKKDLPGCPDLVLRKYKTVIFIHGCFWHQHKECNEGKIPSTNSLYWQHKLNKNILRDEKNLKLLKEAGWKVIIIWECEVAKSYSDTLNNAIIKIKCG